MALLALVLTFAWIVLVTAVPTILAIRRSGRGPVVARGARGSAQWWSQLISSLGFALAIAAPVAELAGMAAIEALDRMAVRLIGVALVVLGGGISLASQVAMGASWRGSIDPDSPTELVTSGPFRLVRNPVLSGVALTATGLALMVPNALAGLMLLAVLASLHVQVRFVEEPHLLAVHGDAYRSYASRTGRFVPGLGRLRAGS